MATLSLTLAHWLEGYNKLIEDLDKKGFVQTPENAREGLANLTRNLITTKPDIAWIKDSFVVREHDHIEAIPVHNTDVEAKVPVRLYHPQPEIALPVLIYIHGGGHMSGSVDVYDPICRKLALTSQHIVVSVDYRLAPEYPYPHGINDAMAVVSSIWTLIDSHDIKYRAELSIAGDSAGGAISATLSHLTQQDSSVEIKRQVLIYPSLDYTMNHASMDSNGKGYLLETDKISWFFEHYFKNNEDREAVSPLHMEFSEHLPDTLLISAQFDPLRDEAFAYIEQLNEVGVENKHLHFDDMIHAFVNMEDLVRDQCAEMYREIGLFLNH